MRLRRWPWSRKPEPDSTPTTAPDPEAASRQLEASKRELERTKAETDYYRGLGTAMRAIRHENHLAETFLAAAHARGGRRD